MKRETVPITPSVLRWAIKEAHYSDDEVASSIGVSTSVLKAWENENRETQPGVAEFKRLAQVLKRQPTVFLLPHPPESENLSINFRHPPGSYRGALVPDEWIHIRKTVRLQKILSWVCQEMEEEVFILKEVNYRSASPDTVADEIRPKLNLSDEVRSKWRDHSVALKSIRGSLEDFGISVFFLPLGENGIDGFSRWDKHAPVIVINTTQRNEASRIFTVFHELAHLLTRTNSACLQGGPRLSSRSDPVERWCERFSASVAMPANSVRSFLEKELEWRSGQKIDNLDVVGRMAGHFKVSLTATTLRLIDLDLAEWSLFRKISRSSDRRVRSFFRSTEGRSRAKIFEQQYGVRSEKLFVKAVKKGVITYSDAIGYADVPYGAFDIWQKKHS